MLLDTNQWWSRPEVRVPQDPPNYRLQDVSHIYEAITAQRTILSILHSLHTSFQNGE